MPQQGTLTDIQTKVRRLSRSPSESQLTDAQLNDYINTFILYDFPEHLRLTALRTTLTFYTQPFVDVYGNEETDPNNPLYDFINKYVAVHPPLFLAGVQCFMTQWREVFYGYYPQTNTIAQTGLFGDNTTGPFTGILLGFPVLQNNVEFSVVDTTGTAMTIIDYPVNNVLGALGLPNQPQTLPSPYGQVNYVTGQFTVNFPRATQTLAPIYSTTITYQPGKPIMMLYYDNQFTLRPVPDKMYTVQFEVDAIPTALLQDDQSPQLKQWWQYIAYGATKKIFEDRGDLESVQGIMPEFKTQERLVLRTTLAQQANERTQTIYVQGKNYGFGWGGFGGAGWPY